MIAIVGNGPVGQILARICQIKGWAYEIIAPNTPPIPKKRIVLNHASITFLETLGILSKEILTPIKQLQISQTGGLSSIHLSSDDYHLPALGYHLDMQALDQQLSQFKHPQILDSVTRGQHNPDHIELCGKTFSKQYDWAFGCDGQNSQIRSIAGIKHTYGKKGYCVMIPASIEHPSPALQRFGHGIIGAYIPNNLAGTIIFCSQQSRLHSWNPCISDIQSFFKGHISIKTIHDSSSFSYQSSISAQVMSGRCILLGNAALTLSPITAQGLNSTLRDLRSIYDLDTLDQSMHTLSKDIHSRHLSLFKRMEVISSDSTIMPQMRKKLFMLNNFLPEIQNHMYYFGMGLLDE